MEQVATGATALLVVLLAVVVGVPLLFLIVHAVRRSATRRSAQTPPSQRGSAWEESGRRAREEGSER